MRKKYAFPSDLSIMFIWVILTFIFVLTPSLSESFLRTILGIPMVLFIPGYVLIAALFPRKNDLEGIERVALSFGLSIAVVPLLGLLLNFITGIKLFPILLILCFYTIALIIVAAYRRGKLPDEEKFLVPFHKVLDTINEEFNLSKSRTDIILTIILIFSIVLAAGMLIHVISTPRIGEKFTEFYILGPDGKAENYPSQLNYNSPATVLGGVVNHEYTLLNYTVETVLNKKVVGKTEIRLDHNETWENNMTFIPESVGTDMKLEFLLYKEDNFTAPYRELHLWVNVSV